MASCCKAHGGIPDEKRQVDLKGKVFSKVLDQFIDVLSSDDGLWVQVGIFVALVLGGLGLPIPEDIPLVLAGAAAAKRVLSIQSAFFTAYFGVLIADQLIFLVGFFFGQRLLDAGTRSPWFPAITEERVEVVRDGLRRKRLIYIFIGRHLFPVRTVTFITAGALRIPFLEFLIADAVAALVSTSMMVSLGYFLGSTLTAESLQTITHQLHFWFGAAVFVGLIAYLIYLLIRAANAGSRDTTR